MKITPISILIPYYKKHDELFVWVQVRNSSDELNGLLEFPGGKVEKDENPDQACIREMKEEANLELKVNQIELFKVYSHSYETKTVLLNVFIHQVDKKSDFMDSGWVQIRHNWKDELANRVPAANLSIIKDIADTL